jgi:hypothetical protein
MHIPIELQPRYRNRKGTLSQNILAIYNFDMQFVYILVGVTALVAVRTQPHGPT